MRNRSSTKSSQRFDIGAVKWYLIIRKGNIMQIVKRKTLNTLHSLWHWVHKDVYRTREIFRDSQWVEEDVKREYNMPHKTKVDYIVFEKGYDIPLDEYKAGDHTRKYFKTIKRGYSYVYKRFDYKIRRKLTLSCRPKNYDWKSLSKSQQKRVIWWQNFCDNFEMWVRDLEYRWEEETCENNKG